MRVRFRGWPRWVARAAAALMLVGLVHPLAAQAPEQRAFVLLRGNDTLAAESYRRTPARVSGTLLVRAAQQRIVYVMALGPAAAVESFQVSVWRATAPDTVPPMQQAVLSFSGDSATLAAGAAGGWHKAVAAGTMPYLNLCAADLEQIVLRARAAGLTTVPAIVPQANTFDVEVAPAGADSVVVTLGGVAVRVAIDSAGHMLGAVVPSQGVRWVQADSVAVGPIAPTDYSAPPGAPYTAESVTVPGPDGPLAGTLTLPRSRVGRIPAVVTITGSGPEDRDESLGAVAPGYRPFRQIADTLSRRGIAVLRMDDRGFGESGGSSAGATSEDFARDIEAGVAYLRGRPEIDPDRIALVGHSEGGIIAPMVAVADPRIRAIVLMAGTAYSGRRVLDYQVRYALRRDSALSGARLDSASARLMASYDSAATRNAWLAFFLRYDPLTTAHQVRVPVLILQGATDRQVTADQAPLLARALRAGGDRDVTAHVFPDRDHLFLRDASGNPAGYAGLPSKKIDPEVLGTLADWLVAHLAAGGETSR